MKALAALLVFLVCMTSCTTEPYHATQVFVKCDTCQVEYEFNSNKIEKTVVYSFWKQEVFEHDEGFRIKVEVSDDNHRPDEQMKASLLLNKDTVQSLWNSTGDEIEIEYRR